MTNTSVVIDAGLAFRALIENPARRSLLALIGSWEQEARILQAPVLWFYEVTSAITKSVLFKTITEAEGRRALGMLETLDVQLVAADVSLALAAFDWTRRLQRVAAYVSFYLGLAETLGCELWTTDSRLSTAANVPWVRVPEV